jgi:hypothetical protein
MADDGQPFFECGVCRRRYRWTPERAGTVIQCECLEPVVVPMEAESDLYDVAPVAVEPVKAVRPAFGRDEGGTVLGYQRAATEVDERYSEANPIIVSYWRDIVAPTILIIVGTAASFVWSYHSDPGYSKGLATYSRAAMEVGFGFAFDVFVMLVGIVVAARILAVNFGSVPTAIMKLGGIALGPSGIAALAIWAMGGAFYPLLVGWTFGLVFYFVLFWYFFDLDAEEVWQTVLIVYGCRIVLGIIWMLIPLGR